MKTPHCVCGRALCGSINRGRWVIRRSESTSACDVQRMGVVTHDNGEAWWVDEGGACLCSDSLENREKNIRFVDYYLFIDNSIRRFCDLVRRKFTRKKRSFVVLRPGRLCSWELYLAGTSQFDEFQFDLGKPWLSVVHEHCVDGATTP